MGRSADIDPEIGSGPRAIGLKERGAKGFAMIAEIA
jgi:hypothetical protein